MGEKKGKLFPLFVHIASTVAHDHVAIAQINQATEVVHDIHLEACPRLPVTVCPCPGFSDIDEELMAQAEVGKTTSLCLAKLLEHVETLAQALRAKARR